MVCLSYAWLQPDHPDPHGTTLRLLARVLEIMVEYEVSGSKGSFGVFIVRRSNPHHHLRTAADGRHLAPPRAPQDFCSMFQWPRDAKQDELFGIALYVAFNNIFGTCQPRALPRHPRTCAPAHPRTRARRAGGPRPAHDWAARWSRQPVPPAPCCAAAASADGGGSDCSRRLPETGTGGSCRARRG